MSQTVSERHLLNAVRRAASGLGARLFRNNVALAWVGRPEVRGPDVFIRDARPLHAGLCTGSSDLIGWTTITVTPEMVGRELAIFTAMELKTGRLKPTPEQAAFVAAVERAGGVAAVVHSVGEAVAAIKGSHGGVRPVPIISSPSHHSTHGNDPGS